MCPINAAATTNQPHPNHRWLIALAGVTMMGLLGTVYAWSTFKKPLMEAHGWLEWQVQLTFMLAIFFLGASAAVGGRLVDRAGTRVVAGVAAVLFAVGHLLAGLADQIGNLPLLWLGYGVIAGIGNGLAYVTPLAVLLRWFPDRKGLITGLAVMGFGLGASLLGKLAPLMIEPDKFGLGTANTFYLMGAAFLVILLPATRLLTNPPEGYRVPNMPPAALATGNHSLTLPEALRTYRFWVLWLALFLNVSAGIGIIGNLSPMAQGQCGISAVAAGTVLFATQIFNGLGRLFWGAVSERIGRKGVFLLLFASQAPLLLILPQVHSATLFTIIACYILLCYGGGFGTMPSFAADTFGSANVGAIYGVILLAWGLAGAVGPSIMVWVKQATGSIDTALAISAALATVGFLLMLTYRRPSAATVHVQGLPSQASPVQAAPAE